MNKDDIFTFNIRQDAPDEYLVECALAWDLTTVVRVSCVGEKQVPFAKKEAIGWMWEMKADEIIAHIQRNAPAIKHLEFEKRTCARCGIVLPAHLPFGYTIHLCDPVNPVPFPDHFTDASKLIKDAQEE